MPDLTLEKLCLFVVAVAPGFIAIQVYSLKSPGVKKDWGGSLVEAVTYSVLNLIFWSWWVVSIHQRTLAGVNPWEITLAGFVICLASPTLLGLGWHWLRRNHLHHKLGLDHPDPRGWEFFVRRNSEFWVLFHLKNGQAFGGYYGGNSYAATYPHEPELYVESLWRVNERGEFTEQVEGTLGGVVRLADCERVEFFKALREEPTDVTGRVQPEQAGGPTLLSSGCPAAHSSEAVVGGAAGAISSLVAGPNATEGGFRNGPAQDQTNVA